MHKQNALVTSAIQFLVVLEWRAKWSDDLCKAHNAFIMSILISSSSFLSFCVEKSFIFLMASFSFQGNSIKTRTLQFILNDHTVLYVTFIEQYTRVFFIAVVSNKSRVLFYEKVQNFNEIRILREYFRWNKRGLWVLITRNVNGNSHTISAKL